MPTQRAGAERACLASLTLYTLVRLVLAGGDSFSYDYANYLTYLAAIADLDWGDIGEQLPVTAPYVLIPGGGLFEVGFVALAKALLAVMSPAWAYAVLGAASVGLRALAMRRLGLGWALTFALLACSITLFEANALRAGLALTLVLLGIERAHRGAIWAALLLMLAAASQHLQALLFAGPFLGLYLFPRRILGRWWLVLGLAVIAIAGTFYALDFADSIGATKLDDYAGETTGASGFNAVSVLSMVWLSLALVGGMLRGPLDLPRATALRSMLAAVPALVLVIFGAGLGAVGDRVWQFALVIVAAQSAHMGLGRLRGGALALLLTVVLVNVLVRYPLSNFFSPPLPYEAIQPLFFAR